MNRSEWPPLATRQVTLPERVLFARLGEADVDERVDRIARPLHRLGAKLAELVNDAPVVNRVIYSDDHATDD